MITTPRHRPVYRRYSPRQLALRVIHEALVDERALWSPGTPVYLALSRAARAIDTAVRCTGEETSEA